MSLPSAENLSLASFTTLAAPSTMPNAMASDVDLLPFVVVVEDDEPIRLLVTALLRRAGYRVVNYGSVEAALEAFDTVVPQVIVSDIVLPGKSGYDLLEAVRLMPHFSETQFIFMSTKGSRQEIRAGMQLGADDYITKPIDQAELLSAVVARLDRVQRLRERVAADLGLPAEIGGYTVIRRLAVGGMSEVFLARNKAHQTVVLKVVESDADTNSHNMKRLMREFQLVANVRDPHVAHFYAYEVAQSKVFLVMEYFPHGDIRTYLKQSQMADLAPYVLRDVLRGLVALHRENLIHRDIKPGNVMIRKQPNPLDHGSYALCDFGLVTLQDVPSSLTRTGEVIGTPFYMSPEQLRADPLTPASDVFSAGVMFYELLTGQRPFSGSNVQECSYKILAQPLPRLGPEYARFMPLLDDMTTKDTAPRLKDGAAALARLEPMLARI